jgi:hypothetical protein
MAFRLKRQPPFSSMPMRWTGMICDTLRMNAAAGA